MWYDRVRLSWQMDFRGPVLQNIRLLVCDRCMDEPAYQAKAIILPADPVPIVQPRPEWFTQSEGDFRVTTAPPVIDPVTGIPIPQGVQLATTQGANRIANPVGKPNDAPLAAVETFYQKVQYGPQLSVITALGDGNNKVTVNCSVAHGLSTGSQVVAQGMLASYADGPWSVDIVISATSFAYYVQNQIPQGVLWSSTSVIWTANIGAPYGVFGYPQV